MSKIHSNVETALANAALLRAEVAIEVLKTSTIPTETLNTLKIRNPVFYKERWEQDQKIGLLVQKERNDRIGTQLILLNEVSEEGYSDTFAWGVVKLEKFEPCTGPSTLASEDKDSVEPSLLKSFHDTQACFYTTMQVEAWFDEPVKLLRTPDGFRFSGKINLSEDADKASKPIPTITASGKTLRIGDFTPRKLKGLDDAELREADQALHMFYRTGFSNESQQLVGKISREETVKAHIFVLEELRKRKLPHPKVVGPSGSSQTRDELDEATLNKEPKLESLYKGFASFIDNIGEHDDVIDKNETLGFREVLTALTSVPLELALPLVKLDGELWDKGCTEGNVELTVHADLSETLRSKIEFALASKLPAHIAKRICVKVEVPNSFAYNEALNLFDTQIVKASSKASQLALTKPPELGGDDIPPPLWRLCEDGVWRGSDEADRVSKLAMKPWTQGVRFLKQDAEIEERYVLGVVLEPEVVDAQKDIYSAEEIRKAAHGFMERYGHIGLMHKTLIDGRVKILESYLSPASFTVNGGAVQKGTWLLAARIVDDALWEKVKKGEFTGWSIGGTAVKEPDLGFSNLKSIFSS